MSFFHTITRYAAAVAVVLLCGYGAAIAQWEEVAPVPVTGDLWSSAASYYNGKIYTFGGVTANSTQLTSASFVYDMSANSWTSGPNMSTPTYFHSATTVNNRIYIFGGQNGAQTVDNFFMTASSFDPVGGSFRQETAMPRVATRAAAVTVGGKAYVIGGMTIVPGPQLAVTQGVLVYDPVALSWTEIQNSVPYAAYGLMATTTPDGTIYIAGGQAANGAGYTSAFKGTVSGNTIAWTPIANLPEVVASGGMSLLNGKVMVAGGISTVEGFRGAYVYDAVNNKWDAYYQLATPHALGMFVGDGNTPYIFGGQGNKTTEKAVVGEAKPVASVTGTRFHLTMKTGDQKTVAVNVENLGVANLEVTLQGDGSTPWLTGSSATVAPSASQELTATINASSLAEGRYTANATVTTNDPSNPSIPVMIDVWVLNDLVRQQSKAVLEEAHGTWCPPCGTFGVPAVANLVSTYGERLIVLSHHDKGGNRYDPFTTTAGEQLNQRLQLNAYPTGAVQRIKWSNNTYQLSAGTEWQQAIAALFEESEHAGANIEVTDYVFDENTRQVSGNIVVTTAEPLAWSSTTSLRASIVITESGITYTQQFSDKPAEVIEHKHAARHYWPNIDGQQIALGSDATVDGGTLLKPGMTFTVPFSFTVPAATTPTSSGDIASLPITPANSHIVFLVHTNEGNAPGPILAAEEMELVQGSVGPAVSINFPGPSTKEIDPQDIAEFPVQVTNHRSEPVEVTISRATNDMPTAWYSEICTDASSCDDADQINFTIPGNGTHTFTLKVYGSTEEETGNVRLVVSAGGVQDDQAYTVNTRSEIGGVAVPGELAGLSMTEITPNPASSVTRIDVTIPSGAQTTLEVYSVTGQKLATLFEGRLEAGDSQIDANVSALQSGKYVLVLTSGDKKVSRTLTIVR